jgi:HAD superfamily hydrolase (TIGR01509 family)
VKGIEKLEKHPLAKALIFDLDGTLSDSLPVHQMSWEMTCARYNCRFDSAIVPLLTGMPTARFAERIIADNHLQGVTPGEMVRIKQELFWKYVYLVKPNPQVIALVYKWRGILPMAVGTGASRRSAELQLQQLGITDCFMAVVAADDVERHKPEPDTFLRCAALMETPPSCCQVFEDGALGMQAATRAGMFVTDVRPFTQNPTM